VNIAAIMSGLTIDSMRGYFRHACRTRGDSSLRGWLRGNLHDCRSQAAHQHRGQGRREVVEHESDSYGEKGENPVGIMLSVMKEKAFWRFIFFLVLLVGVKLASLHASVSRNAKVLRTRAGRLRSNQNFKTR
jgi:hypothetical protein